MPTDEQTANINKGMTKTKERRDNTVEGDTDESLKDSKRQRYMYVPDDVDGELEAEYERLRYESAKAFGGWKPEKNRHYYPVLIALGVQQLESMSAEEFLEVVDETVDESLPTDN